MWDPYKFLFLKEGYLYISIYSITWRFFWNHKEFLFCWLFLKLLSRFFLNHWKFLQFVLKFLKLGQRFYHKPLCRSYIVDSYVLFWFWSRTWKFCSVLCSFLLHFMWGRMVVVEVAKGTPRRTALIYYVRTLGFCFQLATIEKSNGKESLEQEIRTWSLLGH